MPLTYEEVDGFLLISVDEGRFDSKVSAQFKDLMRKLEASDVDRILLDLTLVKSLDSSFLGALIAVRKRIDAHQSIELIGLTPPVARVFSLTRMDKIFAIHPDFTAAKKAGYQLK